MARTTTENGVCITYIGHATVLIQVDGVNILTDPIFSDRCTLKKRAQKPPLDFSTLPPIDYVLISHAHFDHLDIPTLRDVPPSTKIVTPRNVSDLIVKEIQGECQEVDIWHPFKIKEVKVTPVPVHHFSGRILLDARRKACGYIIQGKNCTVYFAGDTATGRHFRAIGQQFDIDVALLPIGTSAPKFLFRGIHMGPEAALEIQRVLGATYMIPIHWGTFRFNPLEKIDTPPKLLRNLIRRRGLQEKVVILKHGESRTF